MSHLNLAGTMYIPESKQYSSNPRRACARVTLGAHAREGRRACLSVCLSVRLFPL